MIDDIIRPSRSVEVTTPQLPPEPQVQKRPDDDAAFYARRIVSMADIVPKRERRPFQDIQRRTTATRDTVVSTTTETTYKSIESTPDHTKEILISVSEIETELVTAQQSAEFYFSGPTAHRKNKESSSDKGTSKRWYHRKDLLRYGVSAFAAMIVLAFTGYVSFDTWITNNEVKQVVAQRQEAVAQSGGVILGEGEDEQEVKPDAVDAYRVAADLPRVLSIEKLGIRARVLPMSVNADGSMQAPVNVFDSGWYGASAKPGTSGAAVIDAHASGATRQGLFAYLDTLAPGDRLTIELGDGQRLTYEVVFTETVPLESVDMGKMLRPYETNEGVNLITCTGKWLPEQKTYDHRVTVYTKRV